MKSFLSLLLAGLMAVPVSAVAESERVPATVMPSGREVVVPAHAVEVAPNIFSLGFSVDAESGQKVEGYMFVHKPRTYEAKPGGARGGKGTKCYAFMASGAKWKTTESWVMNPANEDNLDELTLFTILDDAVWLWEDAADGAVNGVNSMSGIIGMGNMTTSTLEADTAAADGQNEVYFGNLDQGTIGVTIVWGVFSGPTQNRRLVEWDQVYNTDYVWGTNGELAEMDFENIATHELGHTFGLSDLYNAECATQTMYGYASEGDTNKRTLEAGDILGISTLY